jgi:REP-associated tyrosine transposase
LRQAINDVRKILPFQSIAWVLLPDHLHTIWTVPETDANFSLRWSRIKQHVTRQCSDGAGTVSVSRSRQKRREGAIWQRRFWEHLIRDDGDLEHHVDYIHYNPVKHGYVARVADWPYSTFHRFVRQGMYPLDWADAGEPQHLEFGE